MPVPNGAMRERCERGNLTGSPYTRFAIPYVLCAALVLGLVLGEDWLQRRSGQSRWTIDQLVWGTVAAAVTVFVLVAGARPSCSVGCLNAAPVAADSAAADDAPGVHRSREPLERERIRRFRVYPVFDDGVQPLVDEDLTRLCRSAQP
jgi:hypothetical protein